MAFTCCSSQTFTVPIESKSLFSDSVFYMLIGQVFIFVIGISICVFTMYRRTINKKKLNNQY